MTPCAAPPELTQTVLSASSPRTTWCVLKQVRISLVVLAFGSYTARPRLDWARGNACAEGLLDPCLQKSGLLGLPTLEVNQTSPFSSIIRLCVLVRLSQMASSPQ